MSIEVFIVWFIIALVCGFTSAFLASKRNRNKTQAFVLGVIFGIFAVIYYLFIDSKDGTITPDRDTSNLLVE